MGIYIILHYYVNKAKMIFPSKKNLLKAPITPGAESWTIELMTR